MALDLKEKIKICKEIGFNHIEVGIDHLEEWEFVYEEKESIQRNGMTLGVHMPMELNACENINYIQKYWMKFFIDHYNKGREINVKYYNLHLGYGLKNKVKKYREKYLENALYFFYTLLEKIKDADIYIENTYSHEGDLINLGNKVVDFQYIFKKIHKNNFGFCYDTGHALIDKDDYISSLNNHIKLLHLNDNDGKEDLHLGLNENGRLKETEIQYLLKLENLQYMVLEMDKKFLKNSKKIISKNL